MELLEQIAHLVQVSNDHLDEAEVNLQAARNILNGLGGKK